jgi:predicted nuclease of restriction endonuclease-like RecB superfamily
MPDRARYDSAWEKRLAADLRALIRDEHNAWTLRREVTPVVAAGSVFLPDFTLTHADGREALVEVVGFWTPEYLADKLRKVSESRLDHLVLVVHRDLAVGGTMASLAGEQQPRVVWFSGVPKAAEVMRAVEAAARR